MADPKQLNRDDLSKFLPNLRAIRAWEQMFKLVPEIEKTISENVYAKSERLVFGKLNVEKDTVLFLKDAFSLDENTEIIFGENAEILML